MLIYSACRGARHKSTLALRVEMGIRVASSSDAEGLSILVASLSHFLLEDGSQPPPDGSCK